MTCKYVFGLCVFAAGSAFAQEDSAQLETLVVTASRTPIALSESGSAVSIITREDIERREAVSIADLLRDVPGIAVSSAGNLGSQTQLRVRGSEANHMLVMIDGIEANDPTAGDEFLFEHLSTTGIERIEIIRGPQSALWGSDAIGGVINVITRPAAGSRESSGFVEAGSFETARLGGRLATGGDRYQVALDVSYLDTEGTNISRSGDEQDGYRSGTINVSGQLNLWNHVGLTFSARHTDSKKDFDTIDFVQTGLSSDADLVADSAQSYLSVAASFRPVGALTHDLKLTYLDTSSENLDGGVQTSALSADKLGLYYQASLELRGRATDSLTFALDHEQADFQQRGAASFFGDPNQDQTFDTTGLVVEYRLSPVERLNLSASTRRDKSSEFDAVTTYRLTGAYALSDGKTGLRASYGTGQKSPTFIERFGFFPNSFLGNPDLRPEQSDGWEIGVDRGILDDRASISATYFNEELTDEINGFAFDAQTFQFTAVNESGPSRRRGIELAGSAQLSESIRLAASYTHLDSTQPDALGQQEDEIRRPDQMASLNLNYSPSARINLNFNLSYNGSQYDIFFPPFPNPSERQQLASYTLVGFAGSFELTDRIELFGRIENLLDENYEDVIGFATAGTGAYVGIRTRR